MAMTPQEAWTFTNKLSSNPGPGNQPSELQKAAEGAYVNIGLATVYPMTLMSQNQHVQEAISTAQQKEQARQEAESQGLPYPPEASILEKVIAQERMDQQQGQMGQGQMDPNQMAQGQMGQDQMGQMGQGQMPPQGMPPQGMPPQGMPPQGMPPGPQMANAAAGGLIGLQRGGELFGSQAQGYADYEDDEGLLDRLIAGAGRGWDSYSDWHEREQDRVDNKVINPRTGETFGEFKSRMGPYEPTLAEEYILGGVAGGPLIRGGLTGLKEGIKRLPEMLRRRGAPNISATSPHSTPRPSWLDPKSSMSPEAQLRQKTRGGARGVYPEVPGPSQRGKNLPAISTPWTRTRARSTNPLKYMLWPAIKGTTGAMWRNPIKTIIGGGALTLGGPNLIDAYQEYMPPWMPGAGEDEDIADATAQMTQDFNTVAETMDRYNETLGGQDGYRIDPTAGLSDASRERFKQLRTNLLKHEEWLQQETPEEEIMRLQMEGTSGKMRGRIDTDRDYRDRTSMALGILGEAFTGEDSIAENLASSGGIESLMGLRQAQEAQNYALEDAADTLMLEAGLPGVARSRATTEPDRRAVELAELEADIEAQALSKDLSTRQSIMLSQIAHDARITGAEALQWWDVLQNVASNMTDADPDLPNWDELDDAIQNDIMLTLFQQSVGSGLGGGLGGGFGGGFGPDVE